MAGETDLPRVHHPVIQPADVMAGLGAAHRDMLATCIALFEDTALNHRVGQWVTRAGDTARGQMDRWRGKQRDSADDAAVATSIKVRADGWRKSRFSDAQLRLVLWIYLRDAFDLTARTCVSTRAAAKLCDDLTARLLYALKPGWWRRVRTKAAGSEATPVTLDAVARQTLEEILKQVLEDKGAATAELRDRLMADVRERVRRLDASDRDALLDAIGADRMNDEALRAILLTGGGLVAFKASVGLAGFSAYILAAQASAFIPLVSGPALVSLVAVLVNPVTVIAAIGGGGWWIAGKVQDKVHAAVATRVIALLAVNGLLAGPAGLRAMAAAFREVPALVPFGDLKVKAIKRYRGDWEALRKAWTNENAMPPRVAGVMDRPAAGTAGGRLGRVLGVSRDDLHDTAALGALTLGDMLYQAFAIDPTVMQAADFSHVADLGNAADFAALADRVAAMDPAAYVGAVSDLKGYVAERVVASQLVRQGYQVSFADASNQPGWDISVDGVPVQIKDTDSLQYLGKHFATYHDQYPVIVNAEMAQKLSEQVAAGHHEAWMDHVYAVEGYNNEVVQHVTESSLHAGSAMDHPHVPAFTLAISAWRNHARYARGEVTVSQAAQQVLLDGGSKMALAAVGGFIGPAVGLLVFGPAGALVLGSVVPVISQMRYRTLQKGLDRIIGSDEYEAWRGRMQVAVDALAVALHKALRAKADGLRCQTQAAPAGDAGDYLRWRLQDDIAGVVEAGCRLDDVVKDTRSTIEMLTANLLQWLGEGVVHPVAYQRELKALTETFKSRPPPTDRLVKGAQRASGKAKDTAARWVRGFQDNVEKARRDAAGKAQRRTADAAKRDASDEAEHES